MNARWGWISPIATPKVRVRVPGKRPGTFDTTVTTWVRPQRRSWRCGTSDRTEGASQPGEDPCRRDRTFDPGRLLAHAGRRRDLSGPRPRPLHPTQSRQGQKQRTQKAPKLRLRRDPDVCTACASREATNNPVSRLRSVISEAAVGIDRALWQRRVKGVHRPP